jgi:hypothetical protein
MSEVDKNLPRLYLYVYRLAIGYIRVAKRGGENYPRFTSVTWFWIFLPEVLFVSLGRPVRKTASSSPVELYRPPGM